MARPLRIEFPDAIYHVTSRGDRGEAIFVDDEDRRNLLVIVGQAMSRYKAHAWAYCLMDNHFHFVIQTRLPNLSRLMRHINGVYTQAFNRRHQKFGHLMQGRFKSIVVDRDAYLLEVCRYVELNPVRASMVTEPQDWPWSSFCANTLMRSGPEWLHTQNVLDHILGDTAVAPEQRRVASKRYAAWVAAGRGVDLWASSLNRQIFLGNDAFVERTQALSKAKHLKDPWVPKAQRTKPKSLTAWLKASPSREQALRNAHVHSGHTMTALAKELGITMARVSQLIAKAEREEVGTMGGVDILDLTPD